MARDLNKQTPYSNKNVENTKPEVPHTGIIPLRGTIANSFNGGHNKAIAYKKVMKNEYHKQYGLKMHIKMLTPLTPAYQKLKMTIRSYFVPNSRVWENADKFLTRNPTDSNVPSEYPNLGGMVLPVVGMHDVGTYDTGNQLKGQVPITQCECWRDMFISSYIPRIGTNELWTASDLDITAAKFPKINALPLRGRVAIYNDYERNKEYTEAQPEFFGDKVTAAEMQNYLPLEENGYKLDPEKYFIAWTDSQPEELTRVLGADYYTMRAKKDNSYYTDYRTELQGFESEPPTLDNAGADLVMWSEWEKQIASARTQAEFANLNDNEILKKLRGGNLLTQGKVQLIGQKTINLNYASVTQSSYNTAENVGVQFQAMGTQGAYSYTEVYVPCYAGFRFEEEGFVHIIATVSADTVFESGIDRELLNVDWETQFRPDNKEIKEDVIFNAEYGTKWNADQLAMSDFNARKILGYKRKWNELLKLPNCIGGDLTREDWLNGNINEPQTRGGLSYIPTHDLPLTDAKTITNGTFAFFEESANTDYFDIGDGANNDMQPWAGKRMWLDYTDLEINKNQAVKNSTISGRFGGMSSGKSFDILVVGQNQIFFVGESVCETDLPIDPDIIGNKTEWGEH